jgi:hypothetical protein
MYIKLICTWDMCNPVVVQTSKFDIGSVRKIYKMAMS